MPAKKSTNSDYETFGASSSSALKNSGANDAGDLATLRPSAKKTQIQNDSSISAPETLSNSRLARRNSSDLKQQNPTTEFSADEFSADESSTEKDFRIARENSRVAAAAESVRENDFPRAAESELFEPTYAESHKQKKAEKQSEQDVELLSRDRWLARNGHNLTYVGVFLFTLVVYFRPYELFPALSALSSMALVVALATVLIYLPTQIVAEGTLTTFSTEVKCILFISLWALLTIPIAKSPADAWGTFDVYSKIVLIFIVMANTLRTRARLKGLMWLGVGVGVMHSFEAVSLYRQGIFKTDGSRVNVDSVGMFGNPNDLALHLAMFIPVAVALGVASKNKASKLVYFAAAGLMVAGNIVTQSRGGFLGLIAVAGVLAWKLGKKQRVKVLSISAAVGLIVLIFAPGNYGMRILSIFNPSLDTSGSSDQRSELLKQSIIVTLRNPQGIGMGNFPIVGTQNLHTHNAYTQVSSELGILALVAYVVMMVSPLKKLAAIERRMFAANDFSWMYYISIGIQASLIGYMVSSFFGPVAYNWYVYYPIAYAICLRRMYRAGQNEKAEKGIAPEKESGLSDYFTLQKA